MALWELEAFAPPNMLGFVRNIVPPQTYRGEEFLPSTTTDDVEYEYIIGQNDRPVMATIVGWDSEAPIASYREKGERLQGELPPIKRKTRISEKEIIRFLQPRAGTTDQQRAIRAVYDRTARLVDGILARKEWLQMQALSEDTVLYNEAGVMISFDFGVPTNQQINLVTQKDGAGTALPTGKFGGTWDDQANAKPITDLMAINQDRIDKGLAPFTRMVCSQKYISSLYNNAQVKAFTYDTTAPNRPLTLAEIQATFARYGIPVPTPYDTTLDTENADGSLTTVRAMAQNKAFLLTGVNPGNTLIGPTAESRILVGTPYSQVRSGIWANTYNTDEPPAEWVKAVGVLFPTMPNIQDLAQMTLG